MLRLLHEFLFAPTAAELVAPVELKVMAWKKDDRKGRAAPLQYRERGYDAGSPGSTTAILYPTLRAAKMYLGFSPFSPSL